MFVTKSITKITAYLLLEMFFLLFYGVKTTILPFWFFFGSFRFDSVLMTDGALCERAILVRLRAMTEADWRPYDPGNEGLYHRLYQASRDACTVAEMLSAAKTKRYPLARLRRMVLSAYLQLPPAPERVPYLRVLAATAAGRAHLRCLRDAGAPVLTKPADVPALGPAAEELFTLESRCTDLYVLARPDLTQAAPGQDYRTTPVIV